MNTVSLLRVLGKCLIKLSVRLRLQRFKRLAVEPQSKPDMQVAVKLVEALILQLIEHRKNDLFLQVELFQQFLHIDSDELRLLKCNAAVNVIRMELALVLKLEDHSAFVGVLHTALFGRGKSELIAGVLLLGLEDDSARQHDGVLRIKQV